MATTPTPTPAPAVKKTQAPRAAPPVKPAPVITPARPHVFSDIPSHITFEVSRAVHPYKQLTSAQRTSSRFSEEPRLGANILRRGSQPLKMDSARMKAAAKDVIAHLASGSIKVLVKNKDGELLGHIVGWDTKKAEPIMAPLTSEQKSAIVAEDAGSKESTTVADGAVPTSATPESLTPTSTATGAQPALPVAPAVTPPVTPATPPTAPPVDTKPQEHHHEQQAASTPAVTTPPPTTPAASTQPPAAAPSTPAPTASTAVTAPLTPPSDAPSASAAAPTTPASGAATVPATAPVTTPGGS